MSYDPTTLSPRILGQSIFSSPSDPTGTTSTSAAVMMGLALAITPRTTGRIRIFIRGKITNGTTADGATAQISYGTGTAPANADALTGTQIGTAQTWTALTGVLSATLNLFGIVTGLHPGTAYWIDLAVGAATGGTASVSKMDALVEEF